MIHIGNRTEWSPIRSVIIRVITKSDDREAGLRFVFYEDFFFFYFILFFFYFLHFFFTFSRGCLQTELDDTMTCYQLIITITISHKSKTFI